MEAVAAEVERAMSAPLALPREIAAARRWITTGVGASEGPARLLATLLRGAGALAEFAPISAYAGEAPPADVCVVVSQRLSPNARIPLAHAGAYAHTLLVTTVDARLPGVTVVRHGPPEEDGLFLRVLGPAAATATVLRIAAAVAGEGEPERVDLGGARARAERAIAHVDPAALFDLVGVLASRGDVALADGLRHKLLEGLGVPHPPVWDVCSLVHGPLQSFYDRDATLVLLEREPSELAERLAAVLRPRHALVRLRSALPGPLALLDFDLQLDHLVVAALRARPRDLEQWPGKGHDAPLYDLGPEI